MLKTIGRIFQFVLIPLFLAGAFFVWSIPRITTDSNFNADELIYLGRSNYWDAYKSGDFTNPIWSSWEVYDQPQLTNYIYAQIPGDRFLLANINSPCTTDARADHYNAWGCLDGKPISTWPASTQPLGSFVARARVLATAISSLAIMTTYYLGLLVSGPLAGILAVIYLGTYTFFRGLSTMVMEDQTLLLFLNLQLILALSILKRKPSNLFLYLLLGLITGLAFATKLSAVIPTIIIYVFLAVHGFINKKPELSKIILSTVCAAGLFLTLHPFLWTDPIGGGLKMLEWRSLQIAGQAGTSNELKSLSDKLSYSLNESFSSFRGDKETIQVITFAALAFISICTLIFKYPSFGIMSGISTLAFITLIPINWSRYLLPIMALISVYLGSVPGIVYQLICKIIRSIKHNYRFISQFGLGALFGFLVIGLFMSLPVTNYLSLLVLVISCLLVIQGFLVTRAMLYSFSHRPRSIVPNRHPHHSFSLIVPARDEASVIGATIQTLSKLNYPQKLYEALIMIRADDEATIHAASAAIETSNSKNIRIVLIDGDAHNKAYSLNIGLHVARHDIIGIFDAEDEPSREILARVNDYFLEHPRTGAVQAPVHLTNLSSNWFSSLSAIEYYYWFSSVLPYLSTKNVVPLGGNTIFTKKEVYQKLGYYDETCLTEDADLGIRLASHNIPVGIITDLRLATREEAPASEFEVIRQRSRWDQGYLQVIDKSVWTSLSFKQQLYALYTLTQPIFRHLSFLNMIFSPLLAAIGVIPLYLALLSFIPAYFLIMQLGLYLLGLAELAKHHCIQISVWRYLTTLLAFVPYQALLTLATLRAIGKILVGNYSWDKTNHLGTHRASLAILEK